VTLQYIQGSRILFAASLACIAGVFVWSVVPHAPSKISQKFSQLYGENVEFNGIVSQDPVVRAKNVQLVLAPLEFSTGSILVSTDKFSSLRYGDLVQVAGKLQEPPVFEDFNYKKYLESKGMYGTMYFPKIELMGSGMYRSWLHSMFARVLQVKHRFRELLALHIRAEESALLTALLLGDQGALSDSLKNKLNLTGLRHIVAVSGQHVVILTNMLMAFFLGLGLWKRQALFLSFMIMVLFILLTGLEASAIRAGIMGGLLLLGQYASRMQASFRVLVFAAALMLLFNPLLLTRDVGFQLSFLAVLGITFSFSFFKYLLKRVPKTLGLQDMIAMNFSAQLFTLPILVYNFGYVSLISPLTNILVLPFIPFLIGVGFVFLAAGAVWGLLGTLLFLPVFLFASYFNLVAGFFSQLPFARIAVENLSPFWLLVFYIPIILFIRKFQKANPSLPFSS
jgi:competence protein ComEC